MSDEEEYYRRCVQSILRSRKQIIEDAFEAVEYKSPNYDDEPPRQEATPFPVLPFVLILCLTVGVVFIAVFSR